MSVTTTAAFRLAAPALIVGLALAAAGASTGHAAADNAAPAATAQGAPAEGAGKASDPSGNADNQPAPANASDFEKHPYIIVDGKVDYGTYDGYRRYAGTCHVCHGPDGLGSSFAPSLVDSLKHLSYSQFLDTVTNGKKNVSASQELVMPSFATNTDIMMTIDHIYAYLKARADGKIGRGRPERMDPAKDPVWKEWKANNG